MAYCKECGQQLVDGRCPTCGNTASENPGEIRRFCKRCGSLVVNGRCPACTPEPATNLRVGSRPVGIIGVFRALFMSGDVIAIATVVGWIMLAVGILFTTALYTPGFSYLGGLFCVLGMLSIGSYAVKWYRNGSLDRFIPYAIPAGMAGFFGVSGLFTFLKYIIKGIFYNCSNIALTCLPALLLLFYFRWRTLYQEPVGRVSLIALATVAASALLGLLYLPVQLVLLAIACLYSAYVFAL